MLRRSFPRHPAVALALGALLLSSTAAHAGPPWISIELPANPHDPATRGAGLVVHTYHHKQRVGYRVTARLEGLVDGRRESRSIAVVPTGRAGVYTVAREWPAAGAWILVVALDGGEHMHATALVGLGADGEVTSVRVPARQAEGGRATIPVRVGEEEIDRALAMQLAITQARAAAAGRAGAPVDPAGAFALLALGLAGLALRGRGRRRGHETRTASDR